MRRKVALRCAQGDGSRAPIGDLRQTDEATGRVRAGILLELSSAGPVTVEELATLCRQESGVVAEHLQDLAAAGYAAAHEGRWVALSLIERHRRRTEAATMNAA